MLLLLLQGFTCIMIPEMMAMMMAMMMTMTIGNDDGTDDGDDDDDDDFEHSYSSQSPHVYIVVVHKLKHMEMLLNFCSFSKIIILIIT